MTEPTEEAVRHALLGVIDPELGDNVVDLGMVRDIAIDGGVATVTIALTVAGCPLQKQLRRMRAGARTRSFAAPLLASPAPPP